MSERAPYSRVYWSIVDDPKFATVFDDDRHLATWLRLLIVADQAHPASANLPHGVRKASVTALVEAGLVDLMGSYRFRIHGLDAERERRRLAATRPPTGTQSGPNRDPVSPGTTGLRRDETSKAEPSLARETDRPDIDAFILIKRRAPSPKQRQVLDDVLQRRDLTGPEWAADVMYRNPDDPIGAVLREDEAWRAERIAAAQAAERPKPKERRSRGLPQSTRDLMAQWAASQKPEEAA